MEQKILFLVKMKLIWYIMEFQVLIEEPALPAPIDRPFEVVQRIVGENLLARHLKPLFRGHCHLLQELSVSASVLLDRLFHVAVPVHLVVIEEDGVVLGRPAVQAHRMVNVGG